MTEVLISDKKLTLIQADVFDGIQYLIECGVKVNCIVTSPPYWGLRVNKDTERLWEVNAKQQECVHGLLSDSGVPPVNQGGAHGATAKIGATKIDAQRPPTKMAQEGMTQWEKWPQGTFANSGRPPTARRGGPDTATAKQLSNMGTFEFMGSPPTPVAGNVKGGGQYSGATRWQHIAQEAKDRGIPVRDVQPGAWETIDQGYWDNRHASVIAAGEKDDIGSKKDARGHLYSAICRLCGAWWGALGFEPTLDCKRPIGELCSSCYVCHILLISRELWKILADDGVFFLNLGDSYIGSNSGSKLKPKDLAGVPGRVVESLQEDGWFRRSDIIWVKGTSFSKKSVEELLEPFEREFYENIHTGMIPGVVESWIAKDGGDWYNRMKNHLIKNAYIGNSMPESVKDRPTRGYEMIYMLTKKNRYWADMEAVKEEHNPDTRTDVVFKGAETYQAEESGRPDLLRHRERWPEGGKNIRNVWIIPTKGFGWQLCTNCGSVYDPKEYKKLEKVDVVISPKTKSGEDRGDEEREARLKRGVCKNCNSHEHWGGHYSSFPESIPEAAILIGCPEGGIVLDPFAGTATTLVVAKRLNREGIGIEMSEDYGILATERLRRLL